MFYLLTLIFTLKFSCFSRVQFPLCSESFFRLLFPCRFLALLRVAQYNTQLHQAQHTQNTERTHTHKTKKRVKITLITCGAPLQSIWNDGAPAVSKSDCAVRGVWL